MLFKKFELHLDDNRRIAPEKGGILVIGLNENKQQCCRLIRKLLKKHGCHWKVIPDDSPKYSQLPQGLDYVKAIFQFPTIIEYVRKIPWQTILSPEKVRDLTLMCSRKHIPLLFIHNYNTRVVTDWVEMVTCLKD